MWRRGLYRTSVLSAQCCCEPKTALKRNVYFKIMSIILFTHSSLQKVETNSPSLESGPILMTHSNEQNMI